MDLGHIGKAVVVLGVGLADRLSPEAVIPEMGSWLAVLSVEVAHLGALHGVDNFIWTKDHDRRLPGLLKPGQSFRPLFEDLTGAKRAEGTIHDTRFEDFIWTGPRIDLLIIDSPICAGRAGRGQERA